MEGYPYYYINPTIWWGYYKNNTTLKRDKYLGSISLVYDITPWLNAMFRTGRDFTLDQFETTHEPIDVVGLQGGYYSNSISKEISSNSDFLITASKDKIFHSDINAKLSGGAICGA